MKQYLLEKYFEKNLELAQKIRKKRGMDKNNSADKAYSESIGVLKSMHSGLTEKEVEESIIDGQNDGTMDIIYIPKGKDNSAEIYDIKGKGNFRYSDIKSYYVDVNEYIFSNKSTDDLNPYAKKQVQKLRNEIKKKRNVKLYVFRSFSEKPKAIARIEKLKDIFTSDRFAGSNLINYEDVVKKIIGDDIDSTQYEWDIKCPKEKIIKRENRRIDTLIVELKISELLKLQKKYIEGNLNLFEKNVREDIGKKDFTETIKKSIKSMPRDFFTLHNGLTMIAEKIEEDSKTNYKIKNPQVVNGCQTLSSILNLFYKKEIILKDLNQANILCKIYCIPKSKIESVCQTTNTQNKITNQDLRSNDEIQKIIEKLLELNGKKYKRKNKGSLDKSKLAQAIYSCIFEKPADSKNKVSSLFDVLNENLYEKIFNTNLDEKKLLKIIEIHEFVHDKIKKIPKKQKTFETHANLHIMAGIYFLHKNNKNGTINKHFKICIKEIKKIIKDIKKNNKDEYSFNKIFSKDKETWGKLKKALSKIN